MTKMKGRYQESAAFEWLFEEAFGSVMQPNQSQPDLFLESFVTVATSLSDAPGSSGPVSSVPPAW